MIEGETGTGKSFLAEHVIHPRSGAKGALVVTDLIMPVLDGPGLIMELKKIDPALPVIAASGHAAGADLVVLHETKCQALLQKPFEITELLREINRVLHPRPGPQA